MPNGWVELAREARSVLGRGFVHFRTEIGVTNGHEKEVTSTRHHRD